MLKKRTIVFLLPGFEAMGNEIASSINAEIGELVVRKFPDGESYVRVKSDVENKDVVIVTTFYNPDDMFLSLLFVTQLIKELGAARILLVSPYLAYLRQDTMFNTGEAVTSKMFADQLSSIVDGLVTVDPHLHRYKTLSEIYSIPTYIVHAAPLLGAWISAHVKNPILIGPDVESTQWVSGIAELVNVPFIVLNKQRNGDRDVEINIPELSNWAGHTAVVVDDIISTAHTMIEVIKHLEVHGFTLPVCIGVHGIFANGAQDELSKSGVKQIVTCNTIPHVTNGIDVIPNICSTVQCWMLAPG